MQKRQIHLELYFSTLFKLHVLKRGALVQCIKGMAKFYSGYTKFLFILYFFFYFWNSFQYFCWFFFQFCFSFLIFFVFSPKNCQYEFFKTEPFISYPLLSALNAKSLKSNFIFEHANPEVDSRSFYINGMLRSSDLFSDDFTRENSKESNNDLDHSIRLTSLGLAARNIFNDLIVRRIAGFARLLRLATDIYS